MSVNYATGLSAYPNKGVCGLPELFDEDHELHLKIDELRRLIQESRYTVVHTGAGISTSVGIPDFRGPRGVWTLEKLGLSPSVSVPFELAKPSLAHLILVELERKNLIHYLVTQNIDGLHFRSGFPRDRLSILHGDMFLETCRSCGTLFARNSPSTTIGLQKTRVSCSYVKPSNRICRGKISDSILDWENDLPEPDYSLAVEHSNRAELHICIGTSLQMYPAASLPLLPARSVRRHKAEPSKLVIINLQNTKLDRHASLLIHAAADRVMMELAIRLGLPIPLCSAKKCEGFYPPLFLRSVHSDMQVTCPWRVLPHPTDGDSIRIHNSFQAVIEKRVVAPDLMTTKGFLKAEPVHDDDLFEVKRLKLDDTVTSLTENSS